MVVRDPTFWRRFSIAVHQDDLAKEEITNRPEMKHSYVTTSSTLSTPSALSPLGSPTSQAPLKPSELSPSSSSPSTTRPPTKPKRTRSRLQKTPSTKPLLRPDIHRTREVVSQAQQAQAPAPAHHLPSVPFPHSDHLSPPLTPRASRWSPYRSTNNISTFSLTGRPPSRFRFWTTITADAAPRDSWLEAQRRKSRQRTWMCWAFWVAFLLLVAGVVVTILVLKSHGII